MWPRLLCLVSARFPHTLSANAIHPMTSNTITAGCHFGESPAQETGALLAQVDLLDRETVLVGSLDFQLQVGLVFRVYGVRAAITYQPRDVDLRHRCPFARALTSVLLEALARRGRRLFACSTAVAHLQLDGS